MKLERCLAIIMLLLRRSKVKANELAKIFEVSIRTIYRDIDTINLAGVPVAAKSGPDGGVYILKEYKIEKGIFTADDIAHLITGLGMIKGTQLDIDLNSILTKVKSLIPDEQDEKIALKKSQVWLDTSSWLGGQKLARHLQVIQQALSQSVCLQFAYQGWKQQHENRMVQPTRLVFKGGSWYLQAFCLLRQDYRLFKVIRMANLAITSHCYEQHVAPPIFQGFDQYKNKPVDHLDIQIKNLATLDRLPDWCIEDEVTLVDGYYRLKLPFVADDYGYSMLLALGSDCLILNNPEVSQELCSRACAIAKQYQDENVGK